MEIKTEVYQCPKCGSYEYETVDADWDTDSGTLRESIVCPKCGALWSEHFSLRWTGYTTYITNANDKIVIENTVTCEV